MCELECKIVLNYKGFGGQQLSSDTMLLFAVLHMKNFLMNLEQK